MMSAEAARSVKACSKEGVLLLKQLTAQNVGQILHLPQLHELHFILMRALLSALPTHHVCKSRICSFKRSTRR